MNSPKKNTKKIIAVVVTVIISLGIASVMTYKSGEDVIQSKNLELKNTLKIIDKKVSTEQSAIKFSDYITAEIKTSTENAISAFSKGGANYQQIMEKLKKAFSNSKLYYLDKNNKVYTTESDTLNLSSEQLAQLKSEGILYIDNTEDATIDHSYLYSKCGDGAIISDYPNIQLPIGESMFTGLPSDNKYILANKNTNEVIFSTEEFQNGKMPDGLVKLLSDESQKDETIKEGFVDIGGTEFATVEEVGDYYIGTYCDMMEIVEGTLGGVFVYYIVIAGITAMLLIYFFRTKEKYGDKVDKVIKVPFLKEKYLNKELFNRTCAIFLVACICVTLFASYTSEMSVYSFQNTQTDKRMGLLTDNLKACSKDEASVKNVVDSVIRSEATLLLDNMKDNPKLINNAELRKFVSTNDVDEISIYDKNGNLEATSTEFQGYPLTRNENDAKYKAWDVINTEETIVYKDFKKGTNKRMVAVKRTDSPGAVVVVYGSKEYTDLLSLYSKEEAINTTDFGNATTFYVKLADTKETFIIKPNMGDISVAGGILPNEVLDKNYTGMAQIAESQYYVNAKTSEGISIVCAIPTSSVNDDIAYTAGVCVGWFLIMFIMLVLCCFCEPSTEKTKEENVRIPVFTDDYNMVAPNSLRNDVPLKRCIYGIIFGTLAATLVFLMSSTINDEMSILGYLFGGGWDKGFNIFALSFSIAFVAIVCISFAVLKWVVNTVCTKFGGNVATMAKMILSILKVIVTVVTIAVVIYQFGANSAAIIAGAGIVGLVVSLAAKDIVTDLLAGLFLIFEGHFRVGDWVTIGDWRGRVEEIGARVSLIRFWGGVKVFNNSAIKNYKNHNKFGDSAAIVTFKIRPGYDLDMIKEAINSKAEEMKEIMPEVSDGIFYAGVRDVSGEYVEIRAMAIAPERRISSYTRKLRMEVYKILKEKGVQLASKNDVNIISDQMLRENEKLIKKQEKKDK